MTANNHPRHSVLSDETETAVLAGLALPDTPRPQAEQSLEELRRLARTAGCRVVESRLFNAHRLTSATLFGPGQVEDLRETVNEANNAVGGKVDTLIVNAVLTPVQFRNLERRMNLKVIDRPGLILDIFAQRARTREGRLQVELAQHGYMLPRLTGRGVDLSRLGGGIGTRGPGETKLETDRRRIRDRMAHLRRELKKVRRTRDLHRTRRHNTPVETIALVGYTNAGKSTLMNTLVHSEILAEDQLFATLDPTTRSYLLPNRQKVLLSDTVGFIRELPHTLVEAFKATFEEVTEADVLLHVIDASSDAIEQQIDTVHNVLEEIDARDLPMIYVFNKIDRLPEPERQIGYLLERYRPSVTISAARREGLDALDEAIVEVLRAGRVRMQVRIPNSEARLLGAVYQWGEVFSAEHHTGSVVLDLEVSRADAARLGNYRIGEKEAGTGG